MTSASFTLPPGCAIAVTPAARRLRRRRGTGRTRPTRARAPRAWAPALPHGDLDALDARHLPRADADRPRPRASARGRWRSTSRACRRATRNRARGARPRSAARLLDDLARAPTSPAAVASRSWTTMPPPTRLYVSSAWSAGSQAPVARRRRFFFARSISSASALEARGDDALEERLGQRLRGRLVDLAVQRDDPAERARPGRPRARCVRGCEIGRRSATPHGFVCLTTTAAGCVELAHGLERGFDVDEVVERELLAARARATRPRASEPGGALRRDVERARLMRVLAVAQAVGPLERQARGSAGTPRAWRRPARRLRASTER